MYALKGGGEAWMQPLIYGDNKLEWPNSATLIQVSSIDDPALATSCEPVEKANSNHSFTQGLAHSVGLRYVNILSRLQIFRRFLCGLFPCSGSMVVDVVICSDHRIIFPIVTRSCGRIDIHSFGLNADSPTRADQTTHADQSAHPW